MLAGGSSIASAAPAGQRPWRLVVPLSPAALVITVLDAGPGDGRLTVVAYDRRHDVLRTTGRDGRAEVRVGFFPAGVRPTGVLDRCTR